MENSNHYKQNQVQHSRNAFNSVQVYHIWVVQQLVAPTRG